MDVRHKELKMRGEEQKLKGKQCLALADSVRRRAEHEILRINQKQNYNHIDASAFVQKLGEEFQAIEWADPGQ